MHARLLELEVFTHSDKKSVCLLVREPEVDEVAHKATQLIEY